MTKTIRLTHANLQVLRNGEPFAITGSDGSAYILRKLFANSHLHDGDHPIVTLFPQDIDDIETGRTISAIPTDEAGILTGDRVEVRLFADVTEWRTSVSEMAERRGIILPAKSAVTDDQIKGWITPHAEATR